MGLFVTTNYKTKGAWAGVGPVLVVSAVLLLYPAALWASSKPVSFGGDDHGPGLEIERRRR